MIPRAISALVLIPLFFARSASLLLLSALAGAAASPTLLEIDGSRFTLNGQPRFLLGFSYYGALGASREFIRQDLEDMRSRGFNWLRVWATWDGFGQVISAVDGEGNPREPSLGELEWLVRPIKRPGGVGIAVKNLGNTSYRCYIYGILADTADLFASNLEQLKDVELAGSGTSRVLQGTVALKSPRPTKLTVEGSTDLDRWSKVSEVSGGGAGEATIQVPAPSSVPRSFVRGRGTCRPERIADARSTADHPAAKGRRLRSTPTQLGTATINEVRPGKGTCQIF